ncbi:50S ribosome-binding GTPase/Dynamin family [Novymonas esmeraldas]|uniref:50S ribosome-binding GTPase/Dynamin family n=1 Tax=Novymonas esmeraldas TaxID=1808958 RepID=A0AAW0EJG7_9TRYP
MRATQHRRLASAGRGWLHVSGVLRQQGSRHKIIIPRLSSIEPDTTTAPSSDTRHDTEYDMHRHLSTAVAPFMPAESAAEVHRAQELREFHQSSTALMEKVWRDSKSHLRKQQALVDTLGVDGAVRETLQPSTTSFREQLRQRPLDRAILQEIYLGLHGRRIERKLKRGVSWEHWITKGDGTAPVFNTSAKALQTFAFGGHIQQVRCATHPRHFPVVLGHPDANANTTTNTTATTASSSAKSSPGRAVSPARQRGRGGGSSSPRLLPRHELLPEVAFIGRTSSGKSSLVNAIVNAMVTPYGHLRGTTAALRFYSVASRVMLVDCPGYGHYDPMVTPAIDADNAVRAMRAYLKTGAASGALEREQRQRRRQEQQQRRHSSSSSSGGGVATTPRAAFTDKTDADDGVADDDGDDGHHRTAAAASASLGDTEAPLRYQPRNIKRVFVCVSAHGVQHVDYAYCDLLEAYRVPFSVVLTKTDAAPIRFLARLTDHTRSQLVRYTQCKEILLTSSLRMAGIDKVQELISSFAMADDPMHGATQDFSSIV